MIHTHNFVEPQNFGTYSIVIQNSDSDEPINQNYTIKHQGFQQNTNQFNSATINNLQEISIPNIKSGIYRKDSNPNLLIASQKTASNVIISNLENYKKIIQLNDSIESHLGQDKSPLIKANYAASDKLSILAYDVLKIPERNLTFDRDKNRILTRDSITNHKIIYKLFTPESLGLIEHKTILKKAKKRKLIKKKKKNMKIPIEKLKITKNSQTRSGRIIKPPKYINNLQNLNDQETNIMENKSKKMKKILNDLKDRDYKYNSSKPIELKFDSVRKTEDEKLPKRIRKLSPDSQCPVCNKILLGKRMKKHFLQYPDHNIKSQQQEERNSDYTEEIYDMSLYKFLVNKVKIQPECEDRTDLLLNEIGDLVEQLQSRSSKLVRNTSGIHFVNSRSAKILGIPEGQYSLDVNAIDAQPDPIQLDEIPSRILAPPPPRLDYNLSISLDDTITAKLNLSADNIIPSEESLLRTVDDLVQEGMKKLGEHNDDSVLHDNVNEPIIHYDHVSDNAVEAVSMKETTTKCPPILDLSIDLFQFNSN